MTLEIIEVISRCDNCGIEVPAAQPRDQYMPHNLYIDEPEGWFTLNVWRQCDHTTEHDREAQNRVLYGHYCSWDCVEQIVHRLRLEIGE